MRLVRIVLAVLAVTVVGVASAATVAAADTDAIVTHPGSALLDGDSVTFGGDLSVPSGEIRRGDLVAFGGNVTVDGTVTQDVVALGGNVVINGTVERDVASLGGSVTLGPEARVGRNISIAGGSLNRAPGAVVGGQVTYGRENFTFNGVPYASAFDHTHFGLGWPGFAFGIVIAIGIVLLALLLLLFFPRQLLATGTTLEQRPLESFGLGCGGLIASLALMILFAITIIFIPVSFALAIAITVAWLFGWAAIFVVTGQRLLRTANRAQELVPALLLGGLLIGILANIPVLNFFVLLIGGSVALGAVIYSRFGTRPPSLPLLGSPTPPPPVPPAATS